MENLSLILGSAATNAIARDVGRPKVTTGMPPQSHFPPADPVSYCWVGISSDDPATCNCVVVPDTQESRCPHSKPIFAVKCLRACGPGWLRIFGASGRLEQLECKYGCSPDYLRLHNEATPFGAVGTEIWCTSKSATSAAITMCVVHIGRADSQRVSDRKRVTTPRYIEKYEMRAQDDCVTVTPLDRQVPSLSYRELP